MGLIKELGALGRKNIRDYGMYIAFAVIIVVFSITTRGIFLTAQNISNLINQTGFIVVMSVAMTLVIITRHIDLSVGFLSGFLGAVAVVGIRLWGLPVWTAIPLVLVIGALIGLFNGFLVAKVGVPAFVVTLGGMFLFQGLLLYFINVIGGGTVIIADEIYIAIGNGFLPAISTIEFSGFKLHLLTLIIGVAAILSFIYFQVRARRNQIKYQFEVTSMPVFIVKLALISVIIGYLFWTVAQYNGISWTAAIMGVVVFVYNFIMSKTTFGRHVYAVGGNPEAAQLSGVNVRKVTMIVFASMSMMAALGGILLTSRLTSAAATIGQGKELDAIAGAFVGGASPAGGIGKVTGSVIGAFVMASMTNGMNLMGIDISIQFMAKAVVLVLAVVFDITTRKTRAKKVKA